MRPGIELNAYPGEINLYLANAVIINKSDQAKPGALEEIKKNIASRNPKARVSVAVSDVVVDKPELLEGKKALVIEDSPTITHGGLSYAAGYVAAKKYGAEIVDPRPYVSPFFKRIYEEYPHIGPVLPSTGYTPEQLAELEKTINNAPVDVVVLATPSDITRLVRINKPVVHVFYRLKIIEGPTIKDYIEEFLERAKKKLT
jgi:predicted GTPase